MIRSVATCLSNQKLLLYSIFSIPPKGLGKICRNNHSLPTFTPATLSRLGRRLCPSVCRISFACDKRNQQHRTFSSGNSSENGSLKFKTTKSGLRYKDEVVGKGESPRIGDTVRVHYTGTLENGTEFDSSHHTGIPIDFPVGEGQVIEGWDQGILTMKVGGKRQLIIPPELAYGNKGVGSIPPGSTLIFHCELIKIEPAPEGLLAKIIARLRNVI